MQRRELIIALVQLGATIVLTWGAACNLLSGTTLAMAWTVVRARSGQSPLASSSTWNAFLTTHSTIRLIFEPLLLPLQAGLALLLFWPYRRALDALYRRIAANDRECSSLRRVLALALMWLVVVHQLPHFFWKNAAFV